jgi:hypothetical protein
MQQPQHPDDHDQRGHAPMKKDRPETVARCRVQRPSGFQGIGIHEVVTP